MDYDPIVFMIDAARNGSIDVKIPVEGTDEVKTIKQFLDVKDIIGIHKEIAGYMAPKLRSVDVQADIKANVTVNVQKFAGNPIEMELSDDMIRPVIGNAVDEQGELKLDEMTVESLRDLCENLEISKQGNKDILIARIEEKQRESEKTNPVGQDDETGDQVDGDENPEDEDGEPASEVSNEAGDTTSTTS